MQILMDYLPKPYSRGYSIRAGLSPIDIMEPGPVCLLFRKACPRLGFVLNDSRAAEAESAEYVMDVDLQAVQRGT
jgi:hypothetical protein